MKFKDESQISDKLSVKAGVGIDDGIKLQAPDPGHYHLHAIMRDSDGKIIQEEKILNQVQTLMLAHVADQMADQGEAAMGWMAIGTGTGVVVGGTTLSVELNRQALDNSTPSHSGAIITYHRTFAAGEGTGVVTEAGVLNAVSSGILGLYNDSISFNKTAGNSLELTWTLTVS